MPRQTSSTTQQHTRAFVACTVSVCTLCCYIRTQRERIVATYVQRECIIAPPCDPYALDLDEPLGVARQASQSLQGGWFKSEAFLYTYRHLLALCVKSFRD